MGIASGLCETWRHAAEPHRPHRGQLREPAFRPSGAIYLNANYCDLTITMPGCAIYCSVKAGSLSSLCHVILSEAKDLDATVDAASRSFASLRMT